MTGVIREQLTGLAATLAGLKDRVRVAVAGELGRAVSEAVRQVVQAAVAGPTALHRPEPSSPHRPSSPDRWDDPDDRWGRNRWDDPDDEGDWDGRRATSGRPDAHPAGAESPAPAVAAAVTAGVCVARLWLIRKGSWLAAAGLGLGVGLLGILGGAVARTAVTVLAAVGDVLGATDALGAGAARLEHL